MKDKVVLYHDSCADGFSGAWVAREKFGSDADYIGVKYQESPPEGLEDKEVYIIDFSYSLDATQELYKKAKSLTLLDHHISAKETTESVPDHMYALDNSGAVLAWKYFFPDEKIPLFLEYVQGADLWEFNLPRAEDFFSFMLSLNFDFEEWGRVVNDFEDKTKREKLLDYGAKLRKYQDSIISQNLEEAQEVTLDGYSALAVNSSVFESQIGNAIIKKGYDVGIIWREGGDGKIKVSLRSDKGGDVDVSKIAEKYGGGGHKSASGFGLNSIQEIPWHLNT